MSSEIKEKTKYWFLAKRYGWGWGLPTTWQGWAVMIFYLILITLSVYIFPPDKKRALFMSSVILLNILLVVVCWIKGEPPKWRWGKK